ncbi:MAG: HNH endonuclease signature motif containing protein [Clostridiaceae bacterium]
MPRKPRKPCSFPACPELTEERYCEKHKKLYGNERGSAASRGYDSKWRTVSKIYLKRNPLCVSCLKDIKFVEAAVVDHIIPHRGDKALFWDESNWQALCKRCHDVKTMTEDRYNEYKY